MLADILRDFRTRCARCSALPDFTVVAVAVLALGIGATSAIFSLVSAVWMKPLPFADEERLVSLWIDNSAGGGPARVEVTPGHYVDWRDRARSFEEMTLIESVGVNFTATALSRNVSSVFAPPRTCSRRSVWRRCSVVPSSPTMALWSPLSSAKDSGCVA